MKRIIKTADAPEPVGAYSQGVIANGLVFVSGQIPLEPATGEMVDGGAAEQTERALENLSAVLRGAGAVLQDVVKVTIFLADLDWFPEVNKVYGGYFEGDPPAREVVEVERLPRGAGIEISAIAISGE